MTPEFVVVHHSGGPADRDVEDIRRWHLHRGWADVGYHFVITSAGVVQVGRPLHKAGAHARGLNSRSLGVCCVGNFNKGPMPEVQWESLLSLVRELCWTYSVPPERVIGHREVNAYVPKRHHTRKQCPGRHVDMDELRAAIVAGETPEALTCPYPKGEV